MSQLIVMEHKDFGRMNVPPAKLQEFLDAGWVEIERVPMSDAAPEPPAPAADAPAKADKPKGKKAAD